MNRARSLSLTCAAAVCVILALTVALPRAARTQGTNPSQLPPDHMDVIADQYFQKSFHVTRDGRGLKSMVVLTVPAGKVAVIENVTAHTSPGITELFLELQFVRSVVGGASYISSTRLPISLLPQVSTVRLPMAGNLATRAFCSGGRPIKIQFSTDATGKTDVWGFISGHLVPEKPTP